MDGGKMHTFDTQVLRFKLRDVKVCIAECLDTDSDPFLDQLLLWQTQLKAALLAKYKAVGAAAATSNPDLTLLPAAQSAPTYQAPGLSATNLSLPICAASAAADPTC